MAPLARKSELHPGEAFELQWNDIKLYSLPVMEPTKEFFYRVACGIPSHTIPPMNE